MNDTVVSAPEAAASQTGIAEYSATERGLAELRHRLSGRVYDVTTTKGMDEAKKDRADARTLRVNLDKLRKQLNEDDQARINFRNQRAKEITSEISALEDPIDSQIKAEESRKERARAERERAEAARLQAINAELNAIRMLPVASAGANAEHLQEQIDRLAADTLDRFDEVHLPTAQQAKDVALEALRRMLAEREELDQQRAELERQRQEQAEREAQEEARRQEQARIDAAEATAAEHIQDIKDIPAGLVGHSSQAIAGSIADVEAIDPNHPRFGSRRVDADAAKVAVLSRLRTMLEAATEQERIAAEQAERQRALDEQAAEQRRREEQAERERQEAAEREAQAQRDREQAEAAAAAQARAEAEERAIRDATWREAAGEAHELLVQLGYGDHLAARKLAAVLDREVQA